MKWANAVAIVGIWLSSAIAVIYTGIWYIFIFAMIGTAFASGDE